MNEIKLTQSEREQKVRAQADYCYEKGLPNFASMYAPRGYCGFCGRDIYKPYSLEEVSKRHFSSCPYCNNSWTN